MPLEQACEGEKRSARLPVLAPRWGCVVFVRPAPRSRRKHHQKMVLPSSHYQRPG
jgi:hypothetical protein